MESGSRGRTQVYLLYDDLGVSSGILAATLDHEHHPEKSVVVGRGLKVSPEWPPPPTLDLQEPRENHLVLGAVLWFPLLIAIPNH